MIDPRNDKSTLAIIDPVEFARRQERLYALTLQFGYDPGKVRLIPGVKIIDYLGQSFTSEGEALPDGEIRIYYDPLMSDARMACCLAHEIQHVKYFRVAQAYHQENEDGPLHRQFADFTPEKLAAQGGVSFYANEHWQAWQGERLPGLFSREREVGGSEPINETIAEVAKALYNWGPDVAINPVWRELQEKINAIYDNLTNGDQNLSPPENCGDNNVKANKRSAIDHIGATVDSDDGNDQNRQEQRHGQYGWDGQGERLTTQPETDNHQ